MVPRKIPSRAFCASLLEAPYLRIIDVARSLARDRIISFNNHNDTPPPPPADCAHALPSELSEKITTIDRVNVCEKVGEGEIIPVIYTWAFSRGAKHETSVLSRAVEAVAKNEDSGRRWSARTHRKVRSALPARYAPRGDKKA